MQTTIFLARSVASHALNFLEPLVKKVYDAYLEKNLVFYVRNFWKIRRRHYEITQNKKYPQIVCDAYLTNVDLKNVEMDGYLASTVQFGFIVLFSVSFPIAPLLALLHNILQRKIDTINIITRYKRAFSIQGMCLLAKSSEKYWYMGTMAHRIIFCWGWNECSNNSIHLHIF